MSRIGFVRITAALLLLVVAAACSSGTPGADQSPVATSTVDLPRSYRFVPAAISVAAGTTVTWTNNDQFTHNVTVDGAEPLQMSPGESVTQIFEAPGLYAYICSLHPKDMKGSVLVTERNDS